MGKVDQLCSAMQEADIMGDAQFPMTEIALCYAKVGQPVFPVRPDNRAPYISKHGDKKGGFHLRTADLRQVDAWWSQFPDALVGIVPGDAECAAYDLDTPVAVSAWVARGLGNLDDLTGEGDLSGLVVETGGKSEPFTVDGRTFRPMHVYHEVPLGASQASVALDGVVTRFDKGYVVAPGSWRRVGDTVLVYRLRGDGPPAPLPLGFSATRGKHQADQEHGHRVGSAIDGFPTAVEILEGAQLPTGMRHSGLTKAAAYLARYLPRRDTVRAYIAKIDADQCGPPLAGDDDGVTEIDGIVDSACAKFGPRTSDGLYDALVALEDELSSLDGPRKAAREAQRLGEIATRHGCDRRALPAILREMRLSERQRTETWSQIRPGHELVDALVQAGDPFLLQGVVFREGDHFLYGEPQALKTFTALDLAGAIATGRDWLGRFAVNQPGLVVIFAGEGVLNLRRRLAAWLQAQGITAEDAEQIPICIVDHVPTLGVGDDGLQKAICEIEEAVREFGQPVRLVVFDTLTRMSGRAGLSMTKVEEFGALLDAISTIGKRFGAATLTLAHSPKSNPDSPAGTFQLPANADCVISAKRLEGSGSEWWTKLHFEKVKDGATPQDIVVRFKQVEFTELLERSLAARGKDGLDLKEAGTDRYVSLASIWDPTFAPDVGDVRAERRMSRREEKVLGILAAQAAEAGSQWVSQSALKDAVNEAPAATGDEPGIPLTSLRRTMEALRDRLDLVQSRYVNPKRKQAGVEWALTDRGHLETTGLLDVAPEHEERAGPEPQDRRRATGAPSGSRRTRRAPGARKPVAQSRRGGAK